MSIEDVPKSLKNIDLNEYKATVAALGVEPIVIVEPEISIEKFMENFSH